MGADGHTVESRIRSRVALPLASQANDGGGEAPLARLTVLYRQYSMMYRVLERWYRLERGNIPQGSIAYANVNETCQGSKVKENEG